MVLPLLLAAGARLAAGAAVRGVATRAVTSVAAKEAIGSAGGRLATNAVGSYGVNAMERAHRNRVSSQQQGYGRQWQPTTPTQARVSNAAFAVNQLSGPTLGDTAASNTSTILQSSQFS